MNFLKAGRWLEEHLRLIAVREIDFKDLVDAAAQRNRMLGGVGDGSVVGCRGGVWIPKRMISTFYETWPRGTGSDLRWEI